MRSQLVYAAGANMENRFMMAVVTMQAVRKLHVASTRIEDTANHVFSELAAGKALDVKVPEVKPQLPIEPLLLSPAI